MNHKRKRPHWARVCGMCKYYKHAGNGRNRRKPHEQQERKLFARGEE